MRGLSNNLGLIRFGIERAHDDDFLLCGLPALIGKVVPATMEILMRMNATLLTVSEDIWPLKCLRR